MIYDETHKANMNVAFEEAKKGIFSSAPNPSVGCVIVKEGKIIARGFHAKCGSDHAEVVALKQAGKQAAGGYCYVTLEPCNHIGRTGRCTDALIDAKVKGVIAAIRDPNPTVEGDGIERLKRAGIDVLVDVEREFAEKFYKNYLFRVRNNRPLVKLKIGMSIDASSAMKSGESKWITSKSSREDVQYLRAASCVILTGVGTVTSDNPSLNVRHPNIFMNGRQPIRVVLDSNLSINNDSKILNDNEKTIIFTCSQNPKSVKKLKMQGSEVYKLPAYDKRVDLQQVFHRLNQMNINQVLVEAGSLLTSEILSTDYWDELIIYMAPKLLGIESRSAIKIKSPGKLYQAKNLELIDATPFDDDVRLTYRKI